MENSTDKRTKSQILRLLDEALSREDQLTEKLGTLQTQLDECRKREDDPRAELNEEALPATKIPFRIDYYKTTENGPFKGIIEHLPSREKKVFKGDGRDVLISFITGFLPEYSETASESILNPAIAPSVKFTKTQVTIPEPPQGPRLMQRLQEAFRSELSEISDK